MKTRNVRRKKAQRYERYLNDLSRRMVPRELRYAPAEARYQYWWLHHGRFGFGGGDVAVPWSVVMKLQGMRGRSYRY